MIEIGRLEVEKKKNLVMVVGSFNYVNHGGGGALASELELTYE